MNAPPLDIQYVISSFLPNATVVETQSVLRWKGWVREIHFHGRQPKDAIRFIKWLNRWSFCMEGLYKISITFQGDWEILMEALVHAHTPALRSVRLQHILGLFDPLPPRLLVGIRAFFCNCGQFINEITTDARVLPVCDPYIRRANLYTFDTIGLYTRFDDHSDMVLSTDTRQTNLWSLSQLTNALTIYCMCPFITTGKCPVLYSPFHVRTWTIVH